MDNALDKIRQRAAELRAELADLEAAERVHRRLFNGHTKGTAKRPKESHFVATSGIGRLAGLSVVEAARFVLAEAGHALHFKDIYSIAKARGYRSAHSKGGNPESFAIILRRNKEIFDPVGAGKFILNQELEQTKSGGEAEK